MLFYIIDKDLEKLSLYNLTHFPKDFLTWSKIHLTSQG